MNKMWILIEKLVAKGEVLSAEFIAEQEKLSQKKLQKIIEKYGMENVKRIYG